MDEVRVLYFAWLRERAGRREERVAPPADVTTVAALMEWLGARHAGLAEAFAIPRLVRAAVNQNFATPATRVAPGDEVAFFPPVTGG
jgi:molybdopterin synthase sulfur carrier subunit